MKIEGKVATIIFRNEKNFWTVMLLKVGKDYVTAVGEIEDIEVDDEIELEGIEDTHKVYGTQFKFSSYKKVLPKTNAALIQYIADNIHGVGKKIARNIVDEFGDETVNVIRFHPDKLAVIKGLNDEKIENLYTFFNDEWEKWNTIEYLSQFSISTIVANKIYQALGKDTISVVKENPYSLLGFVKALDFNTVDEIGQNMGVSLYNEDRLDNGVIYAISKITDFGHTCVEKENLLNYASSILKVGVNDVLESVNRLCMNEKLYIQEIESEDFVFRRSYYLAEENIAKSIAAHLKKKIRQKNYDKEIEKVSEKNSLVLSDEQKEVIQNCLNSPVSVITGGPGTGKTTIIKCIIDILENLEKEYVLCAPTGRAAKRITETTGKEAKTLHRLLEIIKLDDNDIDMFLDYEVKTIEKDVIIVDEASMIDCMMMNNLIKGIKPSSQMIIVGDVNQLPSVGPGSVLKDIIDSHMVKVSYLKHIYRQSAESDIVVNAHKVNAGEYPVFKNKNTDLFFIQTSSIDDTISEITSLVSYRLETFAQFDIVKDLQILTPTKKTELGTVQLNATLQNILNPKSPKKNEKEIGDKIFREGDKVMQIVNNYEKKFAIDGNHFEGIYNGDIGYIQTINTPEEKMYILFDDDRLVEYDFEELEELEHAYAVTIHKSQGSEFDYVILPLYTGYTKLLTRNLLYTAMTRAKKMLIIVGNRNVLNYMVDNIESKNRKTGLKYKIMDEVEK
ncbi:MAG: ATP-dependent RecD-like DNA helicase [Clostridia bacterium]|nr:ATP-dependent RecD-like DNA helicase [Clostridia bacterium]